jgi:hypothetical protein
MVSGLTFDGQSIRKEKGMVKEKDRSKGKYPVSSKKSLPIFSIN